jgi:lipid A 3-O-deacylase
MPKRVHRLRSICLPSLWLSIALGLHAPAGATEIAASSQRILAIGVIAHDRGFASDHHEAGIDLNLECQFAPLNFPGSPRPHLGATLNFQGDTSMAYAGLGFRARETPRWFADLHLSAALHDGPLHKDPVGCRLNSDCGYGVRVMPRLGVEIAYRIRPDATVSLLYDHMSHKWIIGGENEGLDHVGVRYLHAY